MRLQGVLVLAVLLGSTVAHSQTDGYTIIDQELWKFEFPDGPATPVGTPDVFVHALAFNNAGTLYGLNLGAGHKLMTLDLNTAAATVIADLDWPFVPGESGLSFDDAGVLWLVARYMPGINPVGEAGLFTIDPITADGVLFGETSFGFTGLASTAGTLLTVNDQADLVALEVTSGVVEQDVGGPSLPAGARLFGLDTDPSGRLWALSSQGCILGAPCPASFELTQIDPQDGSVIATVGTQLPATTTAGPTAWGFAIDPRSRGVGCGLVNEPAATLLVPYFEVDVEDPGGRDTLVSIGTVETEATLVHAVLWTNQGHPALSFDLAGPPHGVRAIRVRDLVTGQLPESSLPGTAFPSCTDPLALPEADAGELSAKLTGQPDPTDGLCRSTAVEEGRLATGYLTFDVVRDCSGAELATPFDEGYFVDGLDFSVGLATHDNLLWGNFFLVDPANDFAQGENAVAVVSDPTKFGSELGCGIPPCQQRTPTTFYRGDDNRMPLPHAYLTRFLSGGGFAGETEFVVWLEGHVDPAECGSDPDPNTPLGVVNALFRNEQGELTDVQSFLTRDRAMRLLLGGEPLPTAERFGSADVRGLFLPPAEPAVPQQIWVMPLIGAEGRFSVGATAIPIEGFCR